MGRASAGAGVPGQAASGRRCPARPGPGPMRQAACWRRRQGKGTRALGPCGRQGEPDQHELSAPEGEHGFPRPHGPAEGSVSRQWSTGGYQLTCSLQKLLRLLRLNLFLAATCSRCLFLRRDLLALLRGGAFDPTPKWQQNQLLILWQAVGQQLVAARGPGIGRRAPGASRSRSRSSSWRELLLQLGAGGHRHHDPIGRTIRPSPRVC
jgi:hypothetical protein